MERVEQKIDNNISIETLHKKIEGLESLFYVMSHKHNNLVNKYNELEEKYECIIELIADIFE